MDKQGGIDRSGLFQRFVAFSAAVHDITNEMTKDMKTEAVTPVQYKILEYLAISQPVTLSEISDCMHMSMPNTSRELKKLIEKGLCEKEAGNEDRRQQIIRLSGNGERLMKEAFQHIEARFAGRIAHLTDTELEEIGHALEVLHRKVFY
jgi:DNA-binding MarR family transcriptional regulator